MPRTDDVGFHSFVEREGGSLLRLATSLVGSRADAEDVLQRALIGCWRRWQSIPDELEVAYARRAVINSARSHGRSARRALRRIDRQNAMRCDSETAGDIDTFDNRESLLGALQRLTLSQRTVLVLRFYEDLSTRDVAKLLGVSEGTVKSQTSRALSRLREVYDDHWTDAHA